MRDLLFLCFPLFCPFSFLSAVFTEFCLLFRVLLLGRPPNDGRRLPLRRQAVRRLDALGGVYRRVAAVRAAAAAQRARRAPRERELGGGGAHGAVARWCSRRCCSLVFTALLLISLGCAVYDYAARNMLTRNVHSVACVVGMHRHRAAVRGARAVGVLI